MKKRKHKYFSNLRYREKLEHRSKLPSSYNNVEFLTTTPDSRYEREQQYRYGLGLFNEPVRGRNYYRYFDRPEVPYTVHEIHTRSRYSKMKKYYKQYSNKIVRQQRTATYNHNQYRKQFDMWWTID